MPKGVIIIAFTFPPQKGIGGKRWYEMANAFAQLGYETHVLSPSFECLGNTIEPFSRHYFKCFYPDVLSQSPKSLWDKLRYRFWTAISKWKSKGVVYDKSIFVGADLERHLSRLLYQTGIKNVIVTGAPFHLCFKVAQLKAKYNFHLTTDLRDPWTWGVTSAYRALNSSRLKVEKLKEAFVLANTDMLTIPSERMKNDLITLYPDFKEKILTLPHGVNKERLKAFKRRNNKSFSHRYCYAGTLYQGFDEFLDVLLTYVQYLHCEIKQAFRYDIFTISEHQYFIDKIKKKGLQDQIQIHPSIPEEDLLKLLSNYSASIIYFPDPYKDFISTKFCELVYLEIPIVYLGATGAVSQWIQENDLGACFTLEDLKNNPLNFTDILGQAQKAHINYEVPSFKDLVELWAINRQ